MQTKRVALWCVMAALAGPWAVAQDPKPPSVPALPIRPAGEAPTPAAAAKPVYDEKADARKDVAAAVARAARDDKRVLIQWGANWCGWCKLLAGTMKSDRELAKKLGNEYEVVHVDVGRFDKNMELAKELGAEFHAIPFLTVLDSHGKPILQQNTEPFETKTDGKIGHDAKKLLAWATQHQVSPRVAADVLASGIAAAKDADKVVFLHFGAPWCGWCHRLEDWMARPEIAAVLAKDFVDVKIDIDRMQGGEQLHEAWLEKAGQTGGGIPWIAFVDGGGEIVAHSTGPKGNTGFPVEPHEIAHFATMLNAAKKRLTEADVDILRASLVSREKSGGG